MKYPEEDLVEESVTYTLQVNGQLCVVENVPARVNKETGEQFFSPTTVEGLQRIVLEAAKPKRTIQTPVFEFGEATAAAHEDV